MLPVITGLVDRATKIGDGLLEPLRPAPGPVVGRWAVGVGEVAAGLPRLPSVLRDLARQLNQFGAVVISEAEIGYDGDEVAWPTVSEIRTHHLAGYLFTGAVGKQVQRLPLWWFPGRGLVLGALTHAALTAVVVVADGYVGGGVFEVRIPAEVRHQGLVRAKTMTPGVLAAVVLADPGVRECVATTAETQGIAIRAADDDALDAAEHRAVAIRSAFGKLRGLVTG